MQLFSDLVLVKLITVKIHRKEQFLLQGLAGLQTSTAQNSVSIVFMTNHRDDLSRPTAASSASCLRQLDRAADFTVHCGESVGSCARF